MAEGADNLATVDHTAVVGGGTSEAVLILIKANLATGGPSNGAASHLD